MSFFDSKLINIGMVYESAFRTPTGGAKDTKVGATDALYALPIILKDKVGLGLPIKLREKLFTIGSGKYASKILNKNYEPIDFTLEGPMQLPTFLGYAVGTVASSTAAQAEVTYVECVADVADSLDETYFVLFDGTATYAVWMDAAEDNTFTADPSLDNSIEVDFATNATAATVAAAVASAVNGDAKFTAAVDPASSARVKITTADSEAHSDAYDVDTNFRVYLDTQGVPATSLAHSCLENITYAMKSFTLHFELEHSGSEDIIVDLFGCVVDEVELDITKDTGAVICRAKCKAAYGLSGGTAHTTSPTELALEPFMWNDVQSSSDDANLRILDEANTERCPQAIDKLTLTIKNNLDFKNTIGDNRGSYPISHKREIELKITGYSQNKNLFDFWRGTWNNATNIMSGATTKLSAHLRLLRTAGTDLFDIHLYNLSVDEHSVDLYPIDDAIWSVDVTLGAATADLDGRQIYLTVIGSTTHTKAYYHNTDEA